MQWSEGSQRSLLGAQCPGQEGRGRRAGRTWTLKTLSRKVMAGRKSVRGSPRENQSGEFYWSPLRLCLRSPLLPSFSPPPPPSHLPLFTTPHQGGSHDGIDFVAGGLARGHHHKFSLYFHEFICQQKQQQKMEKLERASQ